MKTTIEQKEAFNEINNLRRIYGHPESCSKPDLIVWRRKLNNLCLDLCDSIFWDELIEEMEFVKSYITY